MSTVRFRHRLEYAAVRLFRLLATLLPGRLAYGLGSLLGVLAGSVLRIRRGVVGRNLARAFPDRPPEWRRRVAGASYRHLGMEAVAILRLSRTTPEALVERTPIQGLEALKVAMEEGRGALILTGHVGNWEVAGASLAARGIPLYAVARKQGNPLFDQDLNRTRERMGLRVIEEGDAVARVVDELRAGHAVALVGDQNVRKGGVFVEFFGHLASTARGPALFALRSGAPVFVGAMLRQEGRPGRYRGVVEPLEVERTGRTGDDVIALARRYSQGLEEIVREAPDQYFWQHKRWKTRPEDASDRNRPPPDPV